MCGGRPADGAPVANAADGGDGARRVGCHPLDCVGAIGRGLRPEDASPVALLTWEDLSVTAASGAVILDKLSGHARPGEVWLLWGLQVVARPPCLMPWLVSYVGYNDFHRAW